MTTATAESLGAGLFGPLAAPRQGRTMGRASPGIGETDCGEAAVPGAGVDGEAALDLELVRRVKRGEPAAFELLVTRHQHRVAALLRRYIRDPAELEDVAQETFLKAWRGLAHFRGESAFYTWLYRIAVNAARNYHASRERRVGLDADPAEAERYDDGALLRETGTPEHTLLTGELEAAMEDALDGLPASLRDAVVLREMKGLTYDEIARAMDCPIGTVRSRISRARTSIDAAIRPLLDEREAAVEQADTGMAPEQTRALAGFREPGPVAGHTR